MAKGKGSKKANKDTLNVNQGVTGVKKKGKGSSKQEVRSLAQQPEIIQKDSYKLLNIITLVGLVILLLYSPYPRGLYFNLEMSTTFLYTGLLFSVFLVHKFLNKDFKIVKSPIDIAVAVLVMAYYIPIFIKTAVSAQHAWDLLLRYITYLFIYLMARDLIAGYKRITILLNAVVVSAVGVSILGIDAGAGAIISKGINGAVKSVIDFLHLPAGISGLMGFEIFGGYQEGRVYSTLQYPNVLASYLGAVFILITGLLMSGNAVWKRFLYGAAGFIVFYTFALTVSRGMFLMLPVMLLILFIVLRRKQLIIDAVMSAGVPALTGAVASIWYLQFVSAGQFSMVWWSVLAGLLVSGTLTILIHPLKKGMHAIRTRTYIFAAVGMALLAVLFVASALNIEKPLVIKHAPNEASSEKHVLRDIVGVKPDTKYSLDFDIDASSAVPGKTVYKVVVYSIDQFFNVEQMAEVTGGPEKSAKKLEFTTKPSTRNIRIYMANFDAGTSAAFSNFNLRDINTGDLRRIIVQYKFLPTDIVYKIKDINLKTHSAWERLVFVQDAFNIIREYPLGAGGGGWRTLYRAHQSYGYSSAEVHSHPVQLWVETGIIGIAALVTIGGLLVRQFFRTRQDLEKTEEDTSVKKIILACTVFIALVSLYAHSVIDFDFSLSAVSILVWLLTGLAAGMFIQAGEKAPEVKKSINYAAVIAVGVLVLVLTVSGFNSVYGRVVLAERNKFNSQVQEAQIKTAASSLSAVFDKYLSLQPLDEERRLDYVRFCVSILNAEITNPDFVGGDIQGFKKQYIDKLKDNIDTSLVNEPNSLKTLGQAAVLYISAGDYDTGLEYAEKMVRLARFSDEAYKSRAELYLIAGQQAVQLGEKDRAKAYFEKAKNIKAHIEEANKMSLKPIEVSEGIDEIIKRAELELSKL